MHSDNALIHAAALIMRCGLARGDRGGIGAPMCALGAIDEAIPYEVTGSHHRKRAAAVTKLAAVVRLLIPTEGVEDEYNDYRTPHLVTPDCEDDAAVIAAWSNMIAKDAEDVAARLREAANQ